jgi:hydroxymethylpyrimidine pyrophosphatase-like HAD family hydrolase
LSERWFRAVALDLDGTLTTGGWPPATVLAEIAAMRADGVRVLLVTGRILSELGEELPGLVDHFDLVVAENGCVLRTGGAVRLLADPVDTAVLNRLRSSAVPVRQGDVLLATEAEADHVALDAIESLALELQLVRNRSALMILPAGVTKGTGLRAALAELELSPHNTLAVGDAENDHSLLAAAGFGVAVANAVESLQRRADLVLPGVDGVGVAELLSGPILTGAQRVPSRRRIVVGSSLDGHPAALPAEQTNLLITGNSESGKSFVAGMIVEQLVALGYVLLLVDPEGDHVVLGALHGVRVFSAPNLPVLEVLATLNGPEAGAVVLDLSGLGAAERNDYVRRLWPYLTALRTRTAMPHWVVVEEAQNLAPCRAPLSGTLGGWGLCLVTYLPQQLAPELLACMEWQIAVSDRDLGGGLVTPPGGEPYAFRLGRRRTRHVRHWHKYVDAPLPDWLSFFFHGEGGPGPRASTIRQFVAAMRAVSSRVIAFHAERQDFSRWLAAAYRDYTLASLVEVAEHELTSRGDPEHVRRLLIDGVSRHYQLGA